MDVIESLLLNCLFLLFPMLIFLIFLENRINQLNKTVIISSAAVSMVLCMTFPITLPIGFIVDMRLTPFVVVALYWGYKHAFVLYIILNLYRYWLGGDGVFEAFLYSSTIFLLVPFFHRFFIKLGYKKRILLAAFVSFFSIAFYFYTLHIFFLPLNEPYWITFSQIAFLYVLIMVILVIFIERIISNIKAREEAFQSDRMDIISELSASVSHEIRNPLTVTKGFLQLLRESTSLSSQEKQYVEYSLEELVRAETIVSDYLALAKPQSKNMVYSNLEEETEYVKNVIMPYANMHEVEVKFAFNNTLNVHYDKNQMKQCLVNLLKNGVESMKDKKGGILALSVSERKNMIEVLITDTGSGMTPEVIKQLGRPYYSTKREGTGLGMMMVYSTINKVGGTIEVESKEGEGTTFRLLIPSKKQDKRSGGTSTVSLSASYSGERKRWTLFSKWKKHEEKEASTCHTIQS